MQPGFPDRKDALFFNFDGTLVDVAEDPSAIRLPPEVPALLARLSQSQGGALAIITGRPLAEMDRYLRPVKLCVAGVYGVERRSGNRRVVRLLVGDLQSASDLLRSICGAHPELQLEVKPGAIALHYRRAPHLEDLCLATMGHAMDLCDGMTLQRGKMVVELKSRHTGKGPAVSSYLDEAPFRQRRPWYFGDDVTDETVFEMVQSRGGVAVKVGSGDTLAAHRLPDPEAVRFWLARTCDHHAAP